MSTKRGSLRWAIFFLLLGIGGFLLWGGLMEREQTSLAAGVIRLHVLANSDSADDQALKLRVRDRILAELSPRLALGGDVTAAARQIQSVLPTLRAAGEDEVRKSGYDYSVQAALEECWFPMREYGGFSLPAGEYTALRVVIGDGGGKNWWCVVFPPLCMGAVSEPAEVAASSGLTPEEVKLITGESEGYVFRFKSIELWEEFKAKFLQ